MVVARTVFDADGRVLLASGMVLSRQTIARLQALGIASIYIKDTFVDSEPEPQDVVSEETRTMTIKFVKDCFTTLEQKHFLNVKAVHVMINDLLDELLANHEIMVNLTDIRAFDDYTFAHSVNVCILSLITGITLGYEREDLRELGIGALLHDIGKVRIMKEILNKPGELTPDELDAIRCHPEYGFDILRTYVDIPLLSAHIAFQHHERWDGQGYPRGLMGEEIHEYARIVAVADVYDALLADRPYRPCYSINQAITIVNRMANTYFDPRAISALLANIAVYPVGSLVFLNTGEIGIIVAINREHPSKPVIRLLMDNNLRRIRRVHEVNLARLQTVYIARTLTEAEIEKFFRTKLLKY